MRYEVAEFVDTEIFNTFKLSIILMSALTWYVLQSLDNLILQLRDYALSQQDQILLSYLVTT